MTGVEHRKLTQAQLLAEGMALFGPDPLDIAFRCPLCGDVATIRTFRDLGIDQGRAGQECIGRHMGALSRKGTLGDYREAGGRGCDWVAYGLIRGPWEIVVPAAGDKPDRSLWAFPLAEQVVPS